MKLYTRPGFLADTLGVAEKFRHVGLMKHVRAHTDGLHDRMYGLPALIVEGLARMLITEKLVIPSRKISPPFQVWRWVAASKQALRICEDDRRS